MKKGDCGLLFLFPTLTDLIFKYLKPLQTASLIVE